MEFMYNGKLFREVTEQDATSQQSALIEAKAKLSTNRMRLVQLRKDYDYLDDKYWYDNSYLRGAVLNPIAEEIKKIEEENKTLEANILS